MTDKNNIISIANTKLDKIPKESFEQFKIWIYNDGLSPSAALNKFMEEHQCPDPDSSVVIRLVEYAYPEIDISRNNFTFKIHDSGYPYTQEELSNEDFDNLIEEMKSLPDGW